MPRLAAAATLLTIAIAAVTASPAAFADQPPPADQRAGTGAGPGTASGTPSETQQIEQSIEDNLIPTHDAGTIAIWLQTRGYKLRFLMPVSGRMTVRWLLGTSANPVGNAPVLVQGNATLPGGSFAALTLKTTPTGRTAIETERSLSIVVVANFTASDGTLVTVQRGFRI